MKCLAAAAFSSLLPLLASASFYAKIGILSHDLDAETAKKVWSMTQNFSTMTSLEPMVVETPWRSHDSAADIARSICSFASRGVDALVYLGPPLGNSFIAPYSDYLGLPFVAAGANGDVAGKYEVSMLPDTSDAAADFIVHFGWERFAFFYDSHDGADRLQRLLRSPAVSEFAPRVDGFWKAPDVRTAVRCVEELHRPDGHARIVLATSEEFADGLAKELSGTRESSILLLTPVATVQRDSRSARRPYTTTKFSITDLRDPVLAPLENRLKTLPSFYARGRTGKSVPDSVILHYDSVTTLNALFDGVARSAPSALRSRPHVDCLDFEGNVSATADSLRKVVVEHGVTGRIQFDQEGRRMDYELDVINSSPHAIQKIGTWSDATGLRLTSNIPKTMNPTSAAQRSEPPLRVTSVLSEPFLMAANGSFRGFIVDFLDELSREMDASYRLHLVKDGFYGRQVQGQWNGMIGELVRGEADLSVAPLIKTPERQAAVDFSKTILPAGLNILMLRRQQEGSYVRPFSFLAVWSPGTWMIVLACVFLFAAAGYAAGRLVGAPDRVRALETKGTDALSPCGSVWLTVGSLLCRDTGIYPRNVTHRLWALLWWTFCIFVSLLYVSMLTSSLIRTRTAVTTTHSRKTSHQLLKEAVETGYPVIGATRYGSTMSLFTNSEMGVFQQYGRFLLENPDAMSKSYDEAVERVKSSGGAYAFIMESTSSDLIANRECDTVVTSGYLATRPIGVALPKNSTLREMVDHGILALTETGRLRELYEKWWHSEKSNCEDPTLDLLPRVYNASMTLHEVSGLFYLFVLFALLSVAAAVTEYYFRTRNIGARL